MKNKLLLVDGMALLFRGYFATAFSGNFMKREDGIATNGVFQFLQYFLNGINEYEPTHVICCWDMGSQTFRTDMYDAYKANRDEPPAELVPQFSLVKDVVSKFNIPNIGIENYEADDIIGSLAKRFNRDNEIIILTGDLDMLQLVTENVKVAIMRKGIGNYELFHEQNFYDKKGLYPEQIIEFKGFTGDSADNYPGVKGIGEVTATRLLQTYGSFAEIEKNIDKLTPAMKRRIEDNIDMFYMSKQLATIKCDLPINIQLAEANLQFNEEKVIEDINQLGVRLRSI